MNIFKRIYSFYNEGFKNMTWGKSVWLIILFKLFIFFFIMKVFFFPDMLKKTFQSDEDRSEYVFDNLTNSK